MLLRSVRFRVASVFGLMLLAGLRFTGQGLDAADQKDLEGYQGGVAFLRALTNRPEGLFSESDQRQLQDLLLQLLHATNYWRQFRRSEQRGGEAGSARCGGRGGAPEEAAR
jgi:hypothetical protein